MRTKFCLLLPKVFNSCCRQTISRLTESVCCVQGGQAAAHREQLRRVHMISLYSPTIYSKLVSVLNILKVEYETCGQFLMHQIKDSLVQTHHFWAVVPNSTILSAPVLGFCARAVSFRSTPVMIDSPPHQDLTDKSELSWTSQKEGNLASRIKKRQKGTTDNIS